MKDHTVFDWAAGLSIVGSLLGYLPPLAAGLAIVWYCILIYDRFKKRG